MSGMEVRRIDLRDGRPETVHLRMRLPVARRLQTDVLGSMLYSDGWGYGNVQVTWPVSLAVTVARHYSALAPPDDVANTVVDCLADGLVLRWWDSLEQAAKETAT